MPASAKRFAAMIDGKARADVRWPLPHEDALYDVDGRIPVDSIGGRHAAPVEGPHCGIACGSDGLVIC